MKTIMASSVACGLAALSVGCSGVPATPASTAETPAVSGGSSIVPSSVPAEYRATYAMLSSNLSDLESQSSSGAVDPIVPPGGTIMAGHLDPADANRGTALLETSTMAEVTEVLDDFAELGMKGVMLEIGYPMLLPSFPNSGAYLSFYEQVAAEIAEHQMTLSVELNPIFPDPRISSLHPDYKGLTVASYVSGQREEAQTVIDDLHPRYLTILDEPSTFAYNLGLPIATSRAVVRLLEQELDGLDRSTTLVGAGIGTWESPSTEQAIATETDVDYLSVHVYPTGPQQIANLDQVTEIAAEARKPLVMDETWLSKSNPSSRPGAGNADIEQKLKNWSFWEPLDTRFIGAISQYSRVHGISLVAPFSTDMFFGYLNWTPSLGAQPSAVVRADVSKIELSNIAVDHVDPVGEAYERAAKG